MSAWAHVRSWSITVTTSCVLHQKGRQPRSTKIRDDEFCLERERRWEDSAQEMPQSSCLIWLSRGEWFFSSIEGRVLHRGNRIHRSTQGWNPRHPLIFPITSRRAKPCECGVLCLPGRSRRAGEGWIVRSSPGSRGTDAVWEVQKCCRITQVSLRGTQMGRRENTFIFSLSPI